MGDTPTFQSNPYGSFDPSQWSNPYSQFYGKALPWPSSYSGAPTNALGQPIQPPPGMTLNQTPAQPQQAPAAAPQVSPGPGYYQTFPGSMQLGAQMAPPGSQPGIQAMYGRNFAAFMPPAGSPMGGQGAQGAGAAGAAGGASAPPNNWQNSLSMLANPGHVTTPGATVPQAAPTSGQPTPGVLQNFLSNWQPAQSGPGSGFTQNFNTILRGLQAQKGG